MRNMQIPVYCPVDDGVHLIEYSGVAVDAKNVMAIVLIPVKSPDDMSIELLVELGMDIPVLVGIAIPDIAVLLIPGVVGRSYSRHASAIVDRCWGRNTVNPVPYCAKMMERQYGFYQKE